MKTLMMSSAFALLFAANAHADQYAVVDFDGNGTIEASDYIGPKSTLDALPAPRAAQYEWKETTRTVTVPGSTSTVPVESLAPEDSNYVNIGEYKGGRYGTLEVAPATTKTITERKRVMVSPAVTAVENAEVYPTPHGSFETSVPSALQNQSIYQPARGADGVITAAELGYTGDEFNGSRIATYDTNGDGSVTANEAISNLDPLLDPNVEAVRDAYLGTNEIVTPESKDL